MKAILFLFSSLLFVLPAPAIHVQEVTASYQPEASILRAQKELAFWNQKASSSPEQYTFSLKEAYTHLTLFKLTA
ncbi:MAG: hypothetical protein AAGI38_19175, partial [Bacteroidota bacterium]